MITTLIVLLILGCVLYLVYYLVTRIAPGRPAEIIGIVLALIFLLYALHTFGIF